MLADYNILHPCPPKPPLRLPHAFILFRALLLIPKGVCDQLTFYQNLVILELTHRLLSEFERVEAILVGEAPLLRSLAD